MTHQLIHIPTLTAVTRAIGGYLPQRTVAEGQVITAPEDHAYVPILERPDFDPAKQRIIRSTTLEGRGWVVVDLTEEELAARNAPPSSLRAWQAKAVLSMANLLEPAEQVIAGLPEPQKTVVTSAWQNNSDFDRESQTIITLAAALGLTSEQLDDMFRQGAALTI